MKKIYFIMISIFIITSTSFSNEISISIKSDLSKIGINETAVITVELDQKAEDIVIPQSDRYTITYQGKSTSSILTIISGKRSFVTTHGYNYVFTPKEIGEYEIDGIEIKAGGKTYCADKIAIEVVEESQRRQRQSQNQFDIFDRFFNQPRMPEVFLELKQEPNEAVLNQQVILEAAVYSTEESVLNSRMEEAYPLSATKTLVYDISSSLIGNNEIYKREIGGREYFGRVIKRYAVYPIEAENIGIVPPFVIVNAYGGIKLKSENIGIKVRDMDETSGLTYIGELNIEMEISTNSIEAGKTIEISVKMTGNGNLKMFSNPYNNVEIEGLFISAPKTEIKFIEMADGLAYFKQEIKYSILAQIEGEFNIPQVEIEYFDNSLIKRKIEIGGFKFEAKAVTIYGNAQTEFIYKTMDKKKHFNFLLYSPIILILSVILLLLPIAAYLYGGHKRRMEGDKKYFRKILANKRLSKYLKDAQKFLKQGENKEFYLALQKGMFYYITDKLEIPASMGYKGMIEKLKDKNIEEKVIDIFKNTYEECNYNAYSGTQNENKVDETLRGAKIIFDSIG